MVKQLPISLHGGAKGEARTQFAALCYAIKEGKIRILLVTSRGQGRWIVPKGWPMDGKTPAEAAAQEAWEEAGVSGTAWDNSIGLYSYIKSVDGGEALPCLTLVYPVKVKKLAKSFPEAKQRRRRWVSRKKAARMVREPELARIIRDFDPRKLQGKR